MNNFPIKPGVNKAFGATKEETQEAVAGEQQLQGTGV